MKTKNVIKCLVLLLFLNGISAQEKLSFSLYQDAKLLIVGDGYYNPGTINFVSRLKMQGKQDKLGYAIVFPEFEYADIDGNYKRLSVNAGYVFNKFSIKDIEASLQIGYGWIDRFGKSTFSASVCGELAYKVLNSLKLSLLAQFTHRTDLKLWYNDDVVRFSGFFGIEYSF